MVSTTSNNMRERETERERQELVNASTASNNTYQIQWQKVGELDVVTKAQAEALARQAEKNGAKRGKALVAAGMRNDPSYRRSMR
jgi:methylphosphotriester-DNA--protein-cysteine methyltransferase